MYKLLIVLIACALCSRKVHSQSISRIDKLGVADGLSQGLVYFIHQDRKGFVWIGTHGGLNRYDGYNFKVFQYIPFQLNTLGDNSVFFLSEDSSTKKFWIGSSSCLNEFDPVTFANNRYYYPNEQLEFSDGLFINKKDLLLACEYKVLLFDTHKKTFTQIPVFDEYNNLKEIGRIENVCRDNKGNFMVMSNAGVFFYNTEKQLCERKTDGGPDFSFLNHYEVFNVKQDRHGYYWIATNKKGLIRFDMAANRAVTVSLPGAMKNESLRFDIITEDSRGSIWAGSSNGLFKIDAVTMLTEYFSTTADGNGLNHPEINAIKEDNNHLMWIGTVGGGINKMIPLNTGFKNFNLNKKGVGTYIMGLQQSGNDIWFQNIWDQVGKVNIQSGEITLVNKSTVMPGYRWYSEGSIVKGSTDSEIIVLNGENTYQLTPGGRSSIHVTAKTSAGLSNIFQTKSGNAFYMVKKAVKNILLHNDTIYGNCFFYDAVDDCSKNIWIGSSVGLIKFNTVERKFVQYTYESSKPNSVSSNFIYAVEVDDSCRHVWMAAYNGGLCSFNISTGLFRHDTKDDGLPDNIVYALEKDSHGNIWFSSNAGISMYNTQSKTFRNYSVKDGLLNHEFNRRASFKNKDGKLFFGGINGIDFFHPDSITVTNIDASLEFSGFKVLNKEYIPGVNNKIPTIELGYDDRFVSIEFALLNCSDRQKIQYAYKMNNGEWINLGNQHSIFFSGLPAGTYHLKVRSTNNDGTWLDNEISCLVIVHPLWWQTWWFKLVALGFVLVTVAMAIRFYYKRKLDIQKNILEKKQAIEQERTRIATDMHDDLGAGLSRIKFLSDAIEMKQQRQQPIEGDIDKIRNYSHEMIDKMGEIVWALNEKNDSLNGLVSYTRAYAVEYLSQNNIVCSITVEESLPDLFVNGEFRRNIFLTVKESLHNIVKHAKAATAVIQIKVDKILFISIKDDGTGFDTGDIKPFRNGIHNMQKRIQDIGGVIQIKSDNGTEITIKARVV